MRSQVGFKHRRLRARYRLPMSVIKPVVEALESRTLLSTYSTGQLFAFGANIDGAFPRSKLVADGQGNLFGTTSAGGANAVGTVFEIVAGSNILTTLASFDSIHGAHPYGGLALDASGNLYGTTQYGGDNNQGTVFELPKGSSTIQTIASFDGQNGANPLDGVILDSSGNLYGTTRLGGPNNFGTVFEIAGGSNSITTLAWFDVITAPTSGVIMDTSGNLFGTATGGQFGDGCVFEWVNGTPNVSTFASFSGTDGSSPSGGVAMDAGGNIYGLTTAGGGSNNGTVFEVAAGTTAITPLASFDSSGAPSASGGVSLDASGNLFGTSPAGGAGGFGRVFELAHGASTITTVASFAQTDGADPQSGVTIDPAGDLVGTTLHGGAADHGTVFNIAGGTASITSLAQFGPTQVLPKGTPVVDAAGNVFGTTTGAGDNHGSIFELAKGSISLTTLAEFNGANGDQPTGPLTVDAAGNIFGTTSGGGSNGLGTIFELAQGSNTITTLASFTDGAVPLSGVTFDTAGNMYGTTSRGGTADAGTIFELPKTGGSIVTLASFNHTNGANPYAGVLIDSAGNLFGTTTTGGANNDGTAFELAQGSSTITAMVSFNEGSGGHSYSGLVQDAQGNFYGTLATGSNGGSGTIFKLPPKSPFIQPIAFFNGPNGLNPQSPIMMDADGNLYGTTMTGGAHNNGTIFEVVKGTSTITTLHSFNGIDGASPLLCGVAIDSAYNIYGMTQNGGGGSGNFYELAYSPAATRLDFGVQPGNWITGKPFVPPFTVNVDDQFGHLITTDNSTVTVSVQGGPSTKIFGTLSEPAVKGVATFDNVYLSVPGSYTLAAKDGTLNGVASQGFVISPAPSTIAGTVFNDLNWDGIQEAGDTAAANITVYLDTNSNGVLDANEPSTVSDSSGAFSFGNLFGSSYTLRAQLPKGWGQVDTTYTLGIGQVVSNALLPVQPPPAAPPVVTPGPTQSSIEEQSASFTLGSFADADPNDGPWKVSVDWGDGTTADKFSAKAPGSLGSLLHTYLNSGAFTVTVQVTDVQGVSGSGTFTANSIHIVHAGDPDPAFGVGGKASLGLFGPGDVTENNAVVLSDGRILVSGQASGGGAILSQYLPNGQLDPSFATGGKEWFPNGQFNRLLVQPDGSFFAGGGGSPFVQKFTAAGKLDTSWNGPDSTIISGGQYEGIADLGGGQLLLMSGHRVVKLKADGSLDTTFANGGILDIPYDDPTNYIAFVPEDAVMHPNGSITIAGLMSYGLVAQRFAAVRQYLPDGTIDSSFASQGTLMLSLGSNSNLTNMKLLADGSMLVSGYGANGPAVAKITPAGAMDGTFGSGGFAALTPGNPVGGYRVALQPDGKILLSGLNIIRLTSAGMLDPLFGANGYINTVLPTGFRQGFGGDDAVYQNGKIVFATAAYSTTDFNSPEQLLLSRYNSDGSTDNTFGANGLALTGFSVPLSPNELHAAVQQDGKIVFSGGVAITASNFYLGRLNADGTTDNGFGANGNTFLDLGAHSDMPWDLTVGPDGKIVAVGHSDDNNGLRGFPWDFAVGRFNPDGSPDSSFGIGGGVANQSGAQFENFNAVAVQPDNKIVAVGLFRTLTGSGGAEIVRYMPDGLLDSSFGTNGKVLMNIGQGVGSLAGMWLTSDGHIVVEGTASVSTNPNNSSPFVARYSADGTPDPTFGAAGVVLLSPGGTTAGIVRFIPDNADAIFVAAVDNSNNNDNFQLTKLLANGSVDSSFGTNGTSTFALFETQVNGTIATADSVSEVRQTADGRFLLAGNRTYGLNTANTVTPTSDMLVMRLNADGSVDTKFGKDSFALIDFGPRDTATDVFDGPAGRIIVTGRATINGQSQWAAARLLGDPTAPPSANAGGPYSGFAGTSINVSGSAVAALNQTISTYEWDFNYDGQTFTTDAAGANATFNAPSGSSGVRTIALRVTDSAHVSTVAVASLTINATSAPALDTGGPYSVTEGGSITVHAKASASPGRSISSYAWDFNYDGVTFTADASGASPVFSAAALDGPSHRTIALKVTDSAGNSSIAVTTVTIQNVAPSATLQVPTLAVAQNTSVQITLANIFDPSAADTAAGFRYSFDLNGDEIYDVVDSTSPTVTVPFNDLATVGSHYFLAKITDKDGGLREYNGYVNVISPQYSSISGQVYRDRNGNRLYDKTVDANQPNISVYADLNNDGVYEVGEPTVNTDSLGNFTLSGLLAPNTYTVRLRNLPANFVQVFPGGDGSITLSISPHFVYFGNLFGVRDTTELIPLINSPFSVPEGGQIQLDGSGSSEATASIVKYEWDTNYNGTTFVTRATGSKIPFSAVGIDGPTIRRVALRVTDSKGKTAIGVTFITINDAPPTAKFSGGSVTIGSAGSVSFSSQADPAPADVTAGFKYSYDFNNDGVFEITDSTSAKATVPASYLPALGTYTIHGRIKDKDGGFTDYTTTITVKAPVIASISGTVFADNNGNARLDAGELGVSGRKLYIDKNKNGILDAGEPTFTTSANGAFTFTGLTAGTYRLRDVLPTGWRRTSPTAGYFDVTLAAGQTVVGKNFAETTNGLISGIVFKDTNANGIKDSTEVALSGWVVFLDTNNNGVLDAGELSFTTGTDGKFSFVVPAGTYHLREVLKSGFKRTTPSTGVYLITLASGKTATGKNFGDR